MSNNNSSGGNRHDLEEVAEKSPEAKHGNEGEAVHGGDQAAPNSSRAGQPIGQQMGDPRPRDRRPN